ncbi:hypothetical protein Nepgr_033435 [Nepenthes gracilis]|uniref:Uncharacterized protein n=1 Tax=Nepenthes gracilis TaxID=150966 RepID=A0AAD3Y8Z1_NEPGR|nr:hypothetical protein Nepgr_033435 [Nepenthes gracilis]
MVNTRAQASRVVASHGGGPNPCTGVENHPDPVVRGLAAQMDGVSQTLVALYAKIDQLKQGAPRGAPDRASHAEASQGGNRGGSRHERPPSRRDNPRTQVASSSRTPRRVEGQPGPRDRDECPERRHSEAQRNRRKHDDQEAVPRDAPLR